MSTKGIVHQVPTEEKTFFDLRIKGGAQTICERIADEIGRENIITKEKVQSVTVYRDFVEVVTTHTKYRSYTIIVAVPPKEVLNIHFSPPLADTHIQAIEKTCTNTVTTFVATFEREFWRPLDLSGECYFFTKDSGPIDYCIDISANNRIAIAGKIYQGHVTNNRFPIYRNEVLAQLAKFLGEEALYPIDYCEKSWTLNSSQMNCWEIGNENYLKEIRQPYNSLKQILTRRLFWAGAETTPEWYGLLGGAVHSGMRAAFETLYVLRPASLSMTDIGVISPSRRSQLQMQPMQTYYGNSVYTAAEHWKLIVSLCFVVLVAVWRMRKGLFRWKT